MPSSRSLSAGERVGVRASVLHLDVRFRLRVEFFIEDGTARRGKRRWPRPLCPMPSPPPPSLQASMSSAASPAGTVNPPRDSLSQPRHVRGENHYWRLP